jgi:hypothetical protein
MSLSDTFDQVVANLAQWKDAVVAHAEALPITTATAAAAFFFLVIVTTSSLLLEPRETYSFGVANAVAAASVAMYHVETAATKVWRFCSVTVPTATSDAFATLKDRSDARSKRHMKLIRRQGFFFRLAIRILAQHNEPISIADLWVLIATNAGASFHPKLFSHTLPAVMKKLAMQEYIQVDRNEEGHVFYLLLDDGGSDDENNN